MRILSAKCLLAGLGLLCCLGLAGCEDNPVADGLRRVSGMGLVEPGVVATVNGRPVLLRQVEALADMNTPGLALAQSGDLDGLWADYADSLYQLVTQELVRQELDKHGLAVDPAEVARVEAMVSEGYSLKPGPEFSALIEEMGFAPEFWRRQVKARLEQELWEQELLKTYVVGADDVEAYIGLHPDLAVSPELYDFIVVEGEDARLLEQRRKAGQKDLDALYRDGFEVSRQRRSLLQLPEVWRADLSSLAPGQVSGQIHQMGLAWAYLILLDMTPGQRRAPTEMYSLAEKAVSLQALPDLYASWLDSSLADADIRMVGQFLPKNVPERIYGRSIWLPWELDEAADQAEDALGEVEGEALPGDIDEEGAQ